MELRNENVSMMSVETDEIAANSPQIQALLKQFAEEANSKKASRVVSDKKSDMIRPVAKKRSSAELREMIRNKESEIANRERINDSERERAHFYLVEGDEKLAKIDAKFEKQKQELLLTESASMKGKESLIAHYTAEIAKLQNDLDNGNYTNETSDEFNTKYAKLVLAKNTAKANVQKGWYDWSHNKLNSIDGDSATDVNGKRSLGQMVRDLKAQLSLLQNDLRDAEVRETMKVSDKDSGSTMDLVDKIMEKEDAMDTFDSSNMNSTKSEIDELMADVSLEDEMNSL